MRPDSIKVDPFDLQDQLHLASRVNFAKVTCVEHNVKVKNYGTVNDASMPHLINQFWQVMLRGRPGIPAPVGQNSPQTVQTMSGSVSSRADSASASVEAMGGPSSLPRPGARGMAGEPGKQAIPS